MTYTQFVSTMNHLYMSKGPKYLVDSVDYWFNLEYTGYCIVAEKDYVLTESIRHKVCITEVGN